jgi:hypothetical protein
MKNTIKTLGIIFIIAAAAFITACGDLPEPDPVVTFDSDGGTAVPKQTVPSGSFAKKPTPDPTKPVTAAGLYELPITQKTFSKWVDANGDEYKFTTTPVTANITLKATWTGTESTPIDVSGQTGTNDFMKAIAYLKAASTTITAGKKYKLILADDITNLASTDKIVLDKANLDLTISAPTDTGGGKTIKSAVTPSGIFIIVGGTTKDESIKLTLNNITLQGNVSDDCLIRVQYGASLTLDNAAYITGHKNSATTGSSPVSGGSGGTKGNGSAVMAYNGGKLYIKYGSISDNTATGTAANRMLVGGVYGYADTATEKSLVQIERGYIGYNHCPHTADVYLTENVNFTLTPSTATDATLTIEDLTLNAASDTSRCAINVPSKIKNDININLRGDNGSGATGTAIQTALTTISGWWQDKVILQATSGYTLTDDDLGKISLGEFRGQTDFSGTTSKGKIAPGYKLELNNTSANNAIVLKKVTTTP